MYSGHMTTTTTTTPTPQPPVRSRQVSYFPAADGRGKYHLRNTVTHEAACGSPVVLDASPMSALVYGADDERVHPIVCRKCVRLARTEG